MKKGWMWSFLLLFGAGEWSHGVELPLPQPLPEQKADASSDKAADKDAKNQEGTNSPTTVPILFPLNPFPPPAPPIMDPRTFAWEQVNQPSPWIDGFEHGAHPGVTEPIPSQIPPEPMEPSKRPAPPGTLPLPRDRAQRTPGHRILQISWNGQLAGWDIIELPPQH